MSMSIEAEWRQALKNTEVPPLSGIWSRIFVWGLIGGVVGGGILLFEGALFWAACAGISTFGFGILFVMLERNRKSERRQSFVRMLMAKIRNDMETKELVAIISALGDLGSTAGAALPLIHEIQQANSTSSVVNEACISALFRITGREHDGDGQPAKHPKSK
jgi:hypothetical protein